MLAFFASMLALAASSVARPLRARADASSLPNADIVCAQNGCMLGQSAVSAGVKLVLASNTSIGDNQTARTILFLPAAQAYSPSTSLRASGNGTSPSLAPIFATTTGSQVAALSGFVSTGSTTSTVQSLLDPAAKALFFASPSYFGQLIQVSASNTTSQLATSSTGSLIMPNASFARLQVGSAQVIAYDSTPDLSQWALGGSVTLLDAQSSSCSQPCGIGGSCAANGTCTCSPGFTGALCSASPVPSCLTPPDACQPGLFGAQCSPCACTNGSTCDDGIAGTGRCIAPVANATTPAACGCTNGVCSGTTSCACNAGWTDAPSSTPSQSNPTRCSVCAQGFYLSSSGDCLACRAGCSSCSASRCNSCDNGLETSQTEPTQCVPTPARLGSSTAFSTCPDGSFNSKGQCIACDPQCSTCHDAGPNSCLVCASPRVLLGQVCVNVDQTSGICNTPSGTKGQFVADNVKKLCDGALTAFFAPDATALPAKCTAGSIPSFSVTSTRADLICSSCIAGSALLANGTCLGSCQGDQFASSNGTCTNCDPSCASCDGAGAQQCTTCPSGSLQLDGACVKLNRCPTGTFANSTGTCAHCSPECSSCSSATACTACPANRPVLTSSGRCVAICGRGFFLGTSGCQQCSSSCATCSGVDSTACLSCSDGKILRGGSCQPASCLNGASTAPGLGVCLESLLTLTPAIVAPAQAATNSKSSPVGAILGATLGVLFVVLALLLCYRRRARKRRAEKTKEFAEKRSIPGLLSGTWFSALRRKLWHDRADGREKSSPWGPSRERQTWHEQKMVVSYPIELAQSKPSSDFSPLRPESRGNVSPVQSLYSKHSRNPFYAMPGVQPPSQHRTGATDQSIAAWSAPASMTNARAISLAPSSLTLLTPSEERYPPRPDALQRFSSRR